jgi:outer membrane protein assembly factor BamB
MTDALHLKPGQKMNPELRMTRSIAATLLPGLILALVPSLSAGTPQWPQFRGPNGSGLAADDKPGPVSFGPEKNVLWKTALPPGYSSPCIWGDRIFLTAVHEGGKSLETLCLNRKDGSILWRTAAPPMEFEKSLHPFSNAASSTPATDGNRVYVYFGAYGTVAYNFAGKEVWNRPLPTPPTQYGTSSSPIVTGGLVILQRDGSSTNSQVLALDSKTGRTRWTAERPLNRESFSTPMVWNHHGIAELVTVGNGRLDAYDPRDGKERWWTPGMTMQPIGVAVAGNGLLFASATGTGSSSEPLDTPDWEGLLKRFDRNGDGRISKDEVPEEAAIQLREEVPKETPGNMLSYQMMFFVFFDANQDGVFTKEEWTGALQFLKSNANNVMALRAGGRGNIASTHIAWKADRGLSEMPSPLYYRDRLYFVRDGGVLTSYAPETGKVVIDRERLGALGQYVASPVAAGGRIYAASVQGKMVILQAGDTLKVLAVNDLKEAITSTPALLEGKLYVRTADHLFAFGE